MSEYLRLKEAGYVAGIVARHGACPKCGGVRISRQSIGTAREQIKYLAAVYGTNCHWCRLPMWMDAPDTYQQRQQNHPCAPSVEHLRPQARRGCDHLANLRLAHQYCNGRRGTEKIYDPSADPGHRRKVVGVLMEIGFYDEIPKSMREKWAGETWDEIRRRRALVGQAR